MSLAAVNNVFCVVTIIHTELTRNEWTNLFGSRDADIGSDLPLWAVQDDGLPDISTLNTFMGGWKTALAKQYLVPGNYCPVPKGCPCPPLPTCFCGGSVDYDTFLE